MFGIIKKTIINNGLFRNSVFINLAYLFFLFFKHFLSNGFRFYSIINLSKYKKSGTLVILGAGSSVNELDESEIDKLNAYDIAGLSYSCVLPFNQTYFFYETAGPHEHSLRKNHATIVFPTILEARDNDRLENLIWKNSEVRIFRKYVDIDSFHCPIFCNVLTDDAGTFIRIFRIVKFLNLSKLFLIQARGSISAITLFAILLGYKRVIFCGVDLNDSGYFFENNTTYERYGFGDPYVHVDGIKSVIHRSNDPKYGIPAIEALGAIFKENHEMEFYVTSNTSDLSSIIPVWNRDRRKA